MKVSFLGLGVMGYPMAGHLARAGHEVTVYNRSAEKSAGWIAEYQGKSVISPAEAAAGAEVICACVGNDDDSLEVGSAAIKAASAGSLYIDHTTTSATCAGKLHALASERGISFVDAPVSGGEAGAVNGALSVMCGGEMADVEKAKALMESYAKRVVHIGPTGHGQLCKAANQIAIAGLLQALSEAVHFSKQSGADPEKVLEAISGGAAQSWQMENRWKTMVEGKFDFGFAVDWMRKDLGIVAEEAVKAGVELPVTAMVAALYDQVSGKGGGRWDTSSLVTLLEQDS